MDRTKYTSDDQHAPEAQKAAANPEAPFETCRGGGDEPAVGTRYMQLYVKVTVEIVFSTSDLARWDRGVSHAGGELHIPREPNYLKYSGLSFPQLIVLKTRLTPCAPASLYISARLKTLVSELPEPFKPARDTGLRCSEVASAPLHREVILPSVAADSPARAR